MEINNFSPSSQANKGSSLDSRVVAEERSVLSEVISAFFEHRKLVASVMLCALLCGLLWSFLTKPVYRATGLLQIEETSAGGAASLKEFGALLDIGGGTTVAAEQELISSRMVLGRVIEKQGLNLEIKPEGFLRLSDIYASFRNDGLAKDGSEASLDTTGSLKVDALSVPQALLNQQLTLAYLGDSKYELADENGRHLLSGLVGKRSEGNGVSIFVSNVVAEDGAKFLVKRLALDTAIVSFLKNFSVKERGKKSGVLEISLLGTDPRRIERVLDDVLNTYVRQNVEKRSAEAEKTLAFLDSQIPIVRRQVEAAEDAYNGYRQERGSLDLSIETQSVLSSVVDVENQLVLMKQERDELRQYFTSEHPRIQAVNLKIEELNARKSSFDKAVARLPDTQQKILRLARDVEVSSSSYSALLNTAQQLKVSKAGTVGDVRVIDNALTNSEPVSYSYWINLAISSVVGVLASIAVILTLRTMRVVVEDPEDIEKYLGLPVLAVIPHSRAEQKLIASKRGGGASLLAVDRPEDDAMEGIRSLRTTIHFELFDSGRNSVLITGPSPGLGKSFLSKNLGVVLAQAGKKVVVVDADLRRGHINKEFNIDRRGGVSEYLSGLESLESVLRETFVPGLFVITTGVIPPNPSDLLLSPRFEEMIKALEATFDLVVVDTPPVLVASDAVVIARHVGATFMVARAGKHPLDELRQSIARFKQVGVTVKGFIFNDFDVDRQRYRYGYKGYVYKYSYGKTTDL
jgi:tyrosine-protein kinase Etk/Wzc